MADRPPRTDGRDHQKHCSKCRVELSTLVLQVSSSLLPKCPVSSTLFGTSRSSTRDTGVACCLLPVPVPVPVPVQLIHLISRDLVCRLARSRFLFISTAAFLLRNPWCDCCFSPAADEPPRPLSSTCDCAQPQPDFLSGTPHHRVRFLAFCPSDSLYIRSISCSSSLQQPSCPLHVSTPSLQAPHSPPQ